MSDPRWRTVAADLAARIRAGEWPVGGPVPSIRALTRHYEPVGYGQRTVRRALTELVASGVLTVRPGARHVIARVPGADEPLTGVTIHGLARQVADLTDQVRSLAADSHRHD